MRCLSPILLPGVSPLCSWMCQDKDICIMEGLSNDSLQAKFQVGGWGVPGCSCNCAGNREIKVRPPQDAPSTRFSGILGWFLKF